MRVTTSNGDEICARRTFHGTEQHGGLNYDGSGFSSFRTAQPANNTQSGNTTCCIHHNEPAQTITGVERR